MSEGFAGFIESMRFAPGEVSPLERARWIQDSPDPEPPDPDERVANLLSRGYRPGETYERAQRDGDLAGGLSRARAELVSAELAEDHARRLREQGRLDPFAWSDVAARADDAREEVARLQGQFAQASRAQRETQEAVRAAQLRISDGLAADGFEAATRRAHAAFAQATRARVAAMGARPRPVAAPRAPRPFVSGAGDGEPDPGAVVRAQQAEADRLVTLGFSAESAWRAVTPAEPRDRIERAFASFDHGWCQHEYGFCRLGILRAEGRLPLWREVISRGVAGSVVRAGADPR